MVTNDDMKRLFGDDAEMIVNPEEIAFSVSIEFAAMVSEKAAEKGLTFAELANRMGKSPQNLSKKLNGGTNLTLKSMAEIAFALGYRIEAPSMIPLSEEKFTSEGFSVSNSQAVNFSTEVTLPLMTDLDFNRLAGFDLNQPEAFSPKEEFEVMAA